jgi:hypothetical protein
MELSPGRRGGKTGEATTRSSNASDLYYCSISNSSLASVMTKGTFQQANWQTMISTMRILASILALCMIAQTQEGSRKIVVKVAAAYPTGARTIRLSGRLRATR